VTQDVTVDGSNLDTTTGANAGGLVALPLDGAQLTARFTGNDIQGTRGNAVLVAGPVGSPSIDATVSGNTIGTAGDPASGSADGVGIAVTSRANTTVDALLENNQVRGYDEAGIVLEQRDGANAVVNATVRGNTLSDPGTASSPTNGIDILLGATAGDAGTACLDIGGSSPNTLTGSSVGTGAFDIFLSMSRGVSAQLPGLGGDATETGVESYLAARNSGATVDASNTGTGAFQDRGSPCPQPPAP
jgi:hypothetical protein